MKDLNRLLRGIRFKPLQTLVAIGLILTMIGVPTFNHLDRQREMAQAFENLTSIQLAKEKFGLAQKLNRDAAVMDAADLVPKFLDRWPTFPPAHANYAANQINSEPTLNGQTRGQIESACTADETACMF